MNEKGSIGHCGHIRLFKQMEICINDPCVELSLCTTIFRAYYCITFKINQIFVIYLINKVC